MLRLPIETSEPFLLEVHTILLLLAANRVSRMMEKCGISFQGKKARNDAVLTLIVLYRSAM